MKIYFAVLLGITALWGMDRSLLPAELAELPFAEEGGLLLDVKEVEVPGHLLGYNASLISDLDHYKLFFRFDKLTRPPYNSYIGVVSLDHNLVLMEDEPVIVLDTNSSHAEDARAFWLKEKIFISYTDVYHKKKSVIHLAELDPTTYEINHVSCFDIGWRPIEKNWTPFVDVKGLKYLYYIPTQKVLEVIEAEDSYRVKPLAVSRAMHKPLSCWKKHYGEMRGGTPALPLSPQEYLAFFHSFFIDCRGDCWYVMGAYTFAANPPHQLLRISPYPLLYSSIYEGRGRDKNKHCIYPAGLVIKEDRLLVSCGENDATIKILIFDKEKLLTSLIDADSPPREKFSRFGP